MNRPLLLATQPGYFAKLLNWKNIQYTKVGNLFKVNDFTEYNNLIDVNALFSTFPSGDPIDRTGSIAGPFKYKILRPWTTSNTQLSLDEVMCKRVQQLASSQKPIHLFWSGGMDSTAMVAAFLQHAPNIDQLELVYTPFSLYENKNFFEHVRKLYPTLKTIDISGDVYLNHVFPGVVITGHGGDELTASLDESFFNLHSNTLNKPWQEHWSKQSVSAKLMEFSEWFFSLSDRPITSLLEARWWFYACCKTQCFVPKDGDFMSTGDSIDVDKLVGFYDFQEFEDYVKQDPAMVLEQSNDYRTYKKFLRRYTHSFFNDVEYLTNYSKVNSVQFLFYRNKKIELNDLRWIAMLSDGSIVRTKNLPLLSKKEFDNKYGTSLDYLFNL